MSDLAFKHPVPCAGWLYSHFRRAGVLHCPGLAVPCHWRGRLYDLFDFCMTLAGLMEEKAKAGKS